MLLLGLAWLGLGCSYTCTVHRTPPKYSRVLYLFETCARIGSVKVFSPEGTSISPRTADCTSNTACVRGKEGGLGVRAC